MKSTATGHEPTLVMFVGTFRGDRDANLEEMGESSALTFYGAYVVKVMTCFSSSYIKANNVLAPH